MEKIGKNDLIDQVASKTGMNKRDVSKMMNATLECLSGNLKDGKNITLTGFGTFEVRNRQARMGVKPGTSEKIEIPASNYAAFKPGKTLREQLHS